MTVNISSIKKIFKVMFFLGYFSFFLKITLLIFGDYTLFRYGVFGNIAIVFGMITVLCYQTLFLKNLKNIEDVQQLKSAYKKISLYGRLCIFMLSFIGTHVFLFFAAFSDIFGIVAAFLPAPLIISSCFDYEKLLPPDIKLHYSSFE
ncbi:MAG: hypothetical protein FWG63_00310 [Defluviitaleaceae bacterium]|nr:hypothetical protein [Defluviitaleaceae bacterium]